MARILEFKLKAIADVKDINHNIRQVQQVINKLKLPDNLSKKFTGIFKDAEKHGAKVAEILSSGFKNKGDVTVFNKSMGSLIRLSDELHKSMGKIDAGMIAESFKENIDPKVLKELNEEISLLTDKLSAIRVDQLDKVKEALKTAGDGAKSSAQSWKRFEEAIKSGDLDAAKKALNGLNSGYRNLNTATEEGQERAKHYKKALDLLQGVYDDLTKEGSEYSNILTEIFQKVATKEGLGAEAAEEAAKAFLELMNQIEGITKAVEEYAKKTDKAAQEQVRLKSEVENFKSKITYFFGMSNAVKLFQRAVRSAYSTVKELDEAMSEIAVVTDFSIGDMWAQLPEYTKRANELGVKIKDVYDSMAIFYQQGLNTEQAVALSNETLKMARIAGLSAADATDRMTNALRGFNMELNETNAQRVDDVYNKLAAITASNVDEISTAMTKVASLASSANMEFETTSAFLAQIIETTRESAETAGTALKTVVARFSEVKNLYSKGQLLGKDEEGEEIDVNRVSTALRSAGINLNEYLAGHKGLDSIFLELAKKWDSLDTVQQRYIATMAAGSRQQSRFLAMMSDYGRTMELVDAANSSAGAANEMYEKTLDSMTTKLNKLKNAWDEFSMGLSNSTLIKAAIDALTLLLNYTNKLTSAAGNTGGAIAKIGLAFAGLKIGKAVISKLTDALIKEFIPSSEEGSKKFMESFKKNINATNFKGFFGKGEGKLTQAFQGLLNKSSEKVSLSEALKGFEASDLNPVMGSIEKQFKEKIKFGELTGEELSKAEEALNNFRNNVDNNIGDAASAIEPLNNALKDVKENIDLTPEMTKQSAASKNMSGSFRSTAAAAAGLSMGLGLLSTGLKAVGASEKWVTAVSRMSAGFGVLAGILVILPPLFKAVNLSIESVPFIGWIAAAVSGLIVLISAASAFIETGAEKAERVSEAAEKAAEAAKSASEAFEGLKNSLNDIEDGVETFETLTRGTEEWYEAVNKVNEKVLELLDLYDGLEIEIGENGELVIKNAEAIRKEYRERGEFATLGELAADAAVVKTELDIAYKDTAEGVDEESHSRESVEEYARAVAGDSAILERYGLSGKTLNEREIGTKMGFEHGEINSLITNGLAGYGKKLLDADLKFKNLHTATVGNVIGSSGISKEHEEVATNFMSPERLEGYAKKYSEYDKEGYEEHFKKVYGDNFKGIGFTGKVNLVDGTSISAKDAKVQYAGAKGAKDASVAVQDFVRALESGSESVELTKKTYEKKDGGALTQSDLEGLGLDNQKIVATKEKIQEQWRNLYGSEPDLESEEYKLFESDFLERIKLANNAFDQTGVVLEDLGLKADVFKRFGLDAGTVDNLGKGLSQVFEKSGAEGAKEAQEIMVALLDGAGDKKEEVAKLLSDVDWTKKADIDRLGDSLRKLGISSAKVSGSTGEAATDTSTLVNKLVDLSGAAAEVNFDNMVSGLKSIADIMDAIRKGEQSYSFDQDSYEELLKKGAGASDFNYNEITGRFDYIGGNIENLIESLKGVSGDAVNESATEVMRGRAAEELLERGWGFRHRSFSEVDTIGTDEKSTYTFLQGYLNKYGSELAGFSQDWLEKNKGDLGALRERSDVIVNAASNLKNTETEYRELLLADAQVYGSPEDSAARVVGPDGEIFAEALFDKAVAAGVAADVVNKYRDSINNAENDEAKQSAANDLASITGTYQEAGDLQIDTEELKQYAESLRETNKELTEAQALEKSLANTKMNQGLGEVISSYDEWTKLIDKNTGTIKASSKDDVAAFNNLKKSVNTMLNTSKDLSDAFWNNAENMKLLERAAEDDTEALGELQKAAAADYIAQVRVEAKDDEAKAALDQLKNLVLDYDIPDLEVDAKITGESDFIKSCNELIAASDMTQSEVNEMFKNMGYDVEYAENPQYPEMEVPAPTTRYSLEWNSGLIPDVVAKVEPNTVSMKSKVPVPTIKSLTPTGSSGGDISTKNRNAAKANAPKKSGGGGGSKGKADKKWENPYDELHNLSQKLNETIRSREKLQLRQERALKNQATTAKELIKISLNTIANLEREADLQRQILEGRKKQLSSIGSKKFQDDEGKSSTFKQLGVTKYASYSMKTGVITIDWEGINKITDTKKGAAVEAYISELEKLSDSYEETLDKLDSIQDEVVKIREQNQQSFLELEQRLYNALVEKEQKRIDEFSKLNDTISETNSEIIKNLQESIALERQNRENEKQEQDISDKEQRLAYLERDTSGANALEILQLRKDLEDTREQYQDSLIDQAIDQMAKDNDLAAEQRAQQIEIMQSQLDYAEENGAYWEEVQRMLDSAFTKGGALNNQSEMVKLLQSTESFKGMSYFGKNNWIQEMSTEWLKAQEGFSSLKVQDLQKKATTAAKAQTMYDGKGGSAKVFYNSKQKKWVDSSGNVYSGVSYDAAKKQYVFTKKTNAPKSTSASKTSSTSAGKETTSTVKNWVSAAIWNGGRGWGTGDTRAKRLTEVFGKNTAKEIQSLVGKGVGKGYNADKTADYSYSKMKATTWKKYKRGGLVTSTGPAWLDGTKSKPEMVLSPLDTKNFIQLKNVLSQLLTSPQSQGDSNQKGGDNYFDISIAASIGSDYDVDRLAQKIKKQIAEDSMYRNVNNISWIR